MTKRSAEDLDRASDRFCKTPISVSIQAKASTGAAADATAATGADAALAAMAPSCDGSQTQLEHHSDCQMQDQSLTSRLGA